MTSPRKSISILINITEPEACLAMHSAMAAERALS